jgi:O-antigen/teichoic acid export membrane protein
LIAALTINAAMMFRSLRHFPPSGSVAKIGLGAVAAGGVSYFVADAALIVYQQVDTVVMSALVDDEQLGWYAAADQLFASLLFVPTILMMTLFPVFGRLHDEEPERLRAVVSRAITSLLLFSVPIGFGTIAVGPPVARLIFGSEFAGAGEVLAVLGVVIIITSETILIGRYAIAIGQQRFWNVLMVLAVVATIPLDLVLVPWTDERYGNGAIGGALAYIVTETAMFVVGAIKFARGALVPATGIRALRILAAGGVMLAAVWPLRDAFLLLPITAGAASYAVAVFVFRALGPEERAFASRITGRLRRG